MGRISDNEKSRERFFLKADRCPLEIPPWECHAHTYFTDGEMSVREAADQAVAIGLTRLVFTEHTEVWRARSAGWFAQYTTAIRAERERLGDRLDIVIGLEAPANDFLHGLDLTPEMEADVEFVMGAAHRYPGLVGRVRDLPHRQAIDLEFRTLMALARNPRVDALAHIGGTCRKYCGEFPMDLVETIIAEATAQGVAIDINPRYHQPFSVYWSLCRKHGAWIVPGSDAHRLEEIGQAFKMLKELCRGKQ